MLAGGPLLLPPPLMLLLLLGLAGGSLLPDSLASWLMFLPLMLLLVPISSLQLPGSLASGLVLLGAPASAGICHPAVDPREGLHMTLSSDFGPGSGRTVMLE